MQSCGLPDRKIVGIAFNRIDLARLFIAATDNLQIPFRHLTAVRGSNCSGRILFREEIVGYTSEKTVMPEPMDVWQMAAEFFRAIKCEEFRYDNPELAEDPKSRKGCRVEVFRVDDIPVVVVWAICVP